MHTHTYTHNKFVIFIGDASSILGLGRSPREEMATHSSIPGKSHGQKSLAGYIVHGVAKESDAT